MDRWVAQRETFLEYILASEAPPLPNQCVECSGTMSWRCDDCFGQPTYCTPCCRKIHLRSPFHRVRVWNGETFAKSSLRKTGLTLYLGHGGRPCPQLDRQGNLQGDTHPLNVVVPETSVLPAAQQDIDDPEFLAMFGLTSLLTMSSPNASRQHSEVRDDPTVPEVASHVPAIEDSPTPSPPLSPTNRAQDQQEEVNSESDTECFQFETGGLKSNLLRFPKGYDRYGNQWMTIADITGVHSLPVHVCGCPGAPQAHLQLLELGIYPVSYDRPQSGFTTRLLDDFDLENLETKCSAQSYYEKLRRLTSNTYPYLVPDRYREFMNCARQWRNLNQHKRAGTLFDSSKSPTRGRLATFCPACPQPGVNLPPEWDKDAEKSEHLTFVLRQLMFLSSQVEVCSHCRW